MKNYSNFKVGDIVKVTVDQWAEPYLAKIGHFNSIGQPYVLPLGERSPKYLFGEKIELAEAPQ